MTEEKMDTKTAAEPSGREFSDKNVEFSEKYTMEKAEDYYLKHKSSLGRRLSNWWEHRMARRALHMAGDPASILDIPCGAGRFWGLLVEDADRELYAADNSAGMVALAEQMHPDEISNRFTLFQTSVFAIDMADNSVDNIFCMRLLHHIEESEDRLRIYKEFHRVAKDTVCLSLWVDGNVKAWRRKRLEADRSTGVRPHKRTKYLNNRNLLERNKAEQEFMQAGFEVTGRVELFRGYAMWCTYVLRKR